MVVEGAWIVDDNVVKPQMTVLSGVSLPQGDYVCQDKLSMPRSGFCCITPRDYTLGK